MDKALRNVLYNTVVKCRELLEKDFVRQLEGVYGIRPDGAFESLDQLQNLDAQGRLQREAIESGVRHILNSSEKYRSHMSKALDALRKGVPYPALAEACKDFARESAFTFLNRIAAVKLFEHPSRQIVQESVSQGPQSKGFRQFVQISPEAMRAQSDGGYRLYLELLFSDLGVTLGALFDSTLPSSILFASATCLDAILDLLNADDLADAWGEDETIGWIYQYFTPGELRRTARDESAAPRDSYELAFRNQFFTPRYVVSFLAENTLGRLWWSMYPETHLTQTCRYLITRDAPTAAAKRDPREFKILDPACGSGHFLLYCFDLLETIYPEAYDDADIGKGLRHDYPDRDAFLKDVPRLILHHNLYGVDIDLRAVQIASLALWMRAQKAFASYKLKIRQRPRIERINIVCAEPMPGEYDLLGEFCRDLQPAALGNMLREIWGKMNLAADAGSLLKIEKEIEETITSTRQQLEALPEAVQLRLFGPEYPVQMPLTLDRRDLQDTAFWQNTDTRIVEELRMFGAQATSGAGAIRRLFAVDAVRGMAFIDLMRQRYDVILMNPPFGAASAGSKKYIEANYPRTKNDLYAAFVERGLELLHPGGYLGAITSRTGFFLSHFQKWREEILLKESNFITMADLGFGVLDTAMVETAAYIVQRKEAENE